MSKRRFDGLKPTDEAPERAVVAKAILRGEPRAADPLAEITALVETAGGVVVASVIQRLDRPHPATYLGKGKVQELAALASEHDADVVITDNDLTPAQERNLERITGRKVVDRSQLIMDIFALRARTRQAKLQVDLAQTRYMLPRLKRLWTHLSRFEGGIGMRGPGETQLEEDKRILSRRIQKLARELKAIEHKKETSLVHRRDEFVVSLVGYTNAGKSTLLNRLTGSRELVEDRLFATLDTRVRRWPLGEARYVLLTDTVGFIRDLPPHLIASFHATLAETHRADLLLHVVDASSPEAAHQIDSVESVLKAIGCDGKETWLVFNKRDALSPDRLVETRHLEADRARGRPSFLVSARTGDGLDPLRDAVLTRLRREDREFDGLIPHARHDVVAFLRHNSEVRSSVYLEEGVRVRAALSPARLGKLRALFPEGFRD
ncbi:MAG: GTPase HflX [Planctomycetota bacterium]